MAFKDRLKEARLNKGFTQENLGNEIGVGKSAIAGYESGKREPDVNKIFSIIQTLGIDANYLWQDEMKNPPAEEPQEDKIHNITDAIPAEDRKIYNLLYEIFVRMGFVEEGKELTPQQVDFCAHILGLMESAFQRKDSNSTNIRRDIG